MNRLIVFGLGLTFGVLIGSWWPEGLGSQSLESVAFALMFCAVLVGVGVGFEVGKHQEKEQQEEQAPKRGVGGVSEPMGNPITWRNKK